MMSMLEWAKEELDRIPKDEEGIQEIINQDILDVVEKFSRQGHSGFSASYAISILEKLLRYKPITPIEDTEGIWNEISDWNNIQGNSVILSQSTRLASLFKYVYADGTIKYRDIDRYVCMDIDNNDAYSSNFVTDLLDELNPITLPYMPTEPIKVYCEDFLVDRDNGDLDTKGILYMVNEEGERVDIYRYFKEENGEWVEISEIEYLARRKK